MATDPKQTQDEDASPEKQAEETAGQAGRPTAPCRNPMRHLPRPTRR